MSWTHLPDDVLARFVAGDLDTLESVRVALHLDECPACAARASAAEPLAQAFASLDDPLPPLDLAPAVVERALAQRPRPERTPAPLVAGGLLVAALAVLVLLGAPGELWARAHTILAAAGSVARSTDLPVGLVTPIWAAAAMFTFAAAAMTGRRLEQGARAWR